MFGRSVFHMWANRFRYVMIRAFTIHSNLNERALKSLGVARAFGFTSWGAVMGATTEIRRKRDESKYLHTNIPRAVSLQRRTVVDVSRWECGIICLSFECKCSAVRMVQDHRWFMNHRATESFMAKSNRQILFIQINQSFYTIQIEMYQRIWVIHFF